MTARDGGPWRGITEAEQVARIAKPHYEMPGATWVDDENGARWVANEDIEDRPDMEADMLAWAQRISDGALHELARPPEPIPWIKRPTGDELAAMSDADFAAFVEESGLRTEAEAVLRTVKACDFCLEGLPKDAEGWHIRRDEEGIEGTARIPCSLGLVPPD